jgi:hypothetical protein
LDGHPLGRVLTVTSRRQSLAVWREADNVDGRGMFYEGREVLDARGVRGNLLACESGMSRRGDGRDIGVNHPQLVRRQYLRIGAVAQACYSRGP